MTVDMVTLPETPIRGETSETDHTQKRRFRHSAIYQTIKALAILRCLYGSEMVLLGVVIGKCEMPSTDISSERPHSGGFFNELPKSMTSLCSANNLADFIMSLQNL